MKKKLAFTFFFLFIPVASFIAAYQIAAREVYYCHDMSQRMAMTSDGYAYITYNKQGRPELLKLSSDGTVVDVYSRERLPWESNTEVAYLWGVFNCEETMLAVVIHTDGETGSILRQEIYRIGENLALSPFLRYDGKDTPQIISLTAKEDKLFVTQIDDSGRKGFVDVFDLNHEAPLAPIEKLEFSSSFHDFFYTAAYVNGSFYASTMSGEVLRYTGGGAVNVFNSPARNHRLNGAIEAFGADGNGISFFDAMDGFTYSIDASGQLKRQDSPAAKYGEHIYAGTGAGAYKLAVVTKEGEDVARIARDGKIIAEFTRMELSPRLIAKKSITNAIVYAGASACMILFIFVILKAFKARQRLLTKFLFIITPIILLAYAGFGVSQYMQLEKMLLTHLDSLAQHYNRTVASAITYSELDGIDGPQAYKRDDFKRILDKLRVDYSVQEDHVSVLNDLFVLRDGVPLVGASLLEPCYLPAKDVNAKDIIELLDACERLGEPIAGTTETRAGKRSTVVFPIKNAQDRIVGYVLTRISHNYVTSLLNDNLRSFARLALLIILPLLAAVTLILRRALNPLSRLRNAMQKVLGGNYEVRLSSATKDEFLGINLAFNKMCADLKTHMYKLERISDSYYRFVPRNILPILKKETIFEVNYGDSRRFSACCCVLCVHNLSEMQACGTDEDFLNYINLLGNFINHSLKQCGGVLMSSELDLRGLQSVFPNSAENGERFAERVCQFCAMNSAGFEQFRPKITMILHKTDMLYGITGVDDAAFPVLLSEGVTFMMRIAPLFEHSGVRIVLTQDILPELIHTPVTEIGWRQDAKGSTCKLYIPANSQKADERFAEGLQCFYRKDFYNARALFSAIWRSNPDNGLAQWYALAADKYLSYPQQFANSQLFGTNVSRADS